jgi:flagellar biosynthetic protein FliP
MMGWSGRNRFLALALVVLIGVPVSAHAFVDQAESPERVVSQAAPTDDAPVSSGMAAPAPAAAPKSPQGPSTATAVAPKLSQGRLATTAATPNSLQGSPSATAATPKSSHASSLTSYVPPIRTTNQITPKRASPAPTATPKPQIVTVPGTPGASTTADESVTKTGSKAPATPGMVPTTSSAPYVAALDDAAKQDYSPVIRTFVLLSLLSLLPVLLIGMTSFTRIIIVLSLLRHALGLPETPPNSVLVTLAIFLTLFSMAPVVDQINTKALQPYLQEKITASNAIDIGVVPIRNFMVRQTREADLTAVLDMAHAPRPKRIEDIKFTQLAPAFLLPFLLVDIVVAAILMALGMIMVPPTTISLPIKILLFILINGWVLISRALLNSYWA